jgi:hypothetical protein
MPSRQPVRTSSWLAVTFTRSHASGRELLQTSYSDLQLSTLIRYIWALSYVPPDMVVSAWTTVIQDKVRQAAPSWEKDYEKELSCFLKYIGRTWIGGLISRTQVQMKPHFPVSLWNKFQSVLEEDALTNNVVEGYNNAFFLSLPACLTDWHIKEHFQRKNPCPRPAFSKLPWETGAQTPARPVHSTGQTRQIS